ncbi:MAG: hypothetical protein R2828_09455 [Saprospiraceae bacterium]
MYSTISMDAKHEELLGILEDEFGIRLNTCMNVVLYKKQPTIFPYTRNKRIPLKLLEEIRTYKGPMFITDRIIENAQENIQFGSFLAYFSLENEQDNPIITSEKKWLVAGEGYKIQQACYFVFPYAKKGIFFLFTKNREEAKKMERHQAVIAEIITAKML